MRRACGHAAERGGGGGNRPGAGLGKVGVEDGFEDGEGPLGTVDGLRWIFLTEYVSGVVRGSRWEVCLVNELE